MQPVDSHGRLVVDKAPEPDKEGILRRSDNYSSWRPSEYHYNIVLDAINHDPASKIDEMLQLHRDMKARGIREDAVTFNTILNGCRRLRDWASFVDVKNQMIERDRCGITRMDAHSWSTLIQGYKELKDWVSVDRYITQATSACHEWFTAQEERRAEDQGIRPTVQLWCTIISTYVDRNMVPQMLAARRIMSGLGLRASTYVFGPIFAALHKARQIAVRKGRDVTPVQRLALSEYEAMQDEGVEPNEVILTNLMLTIGYSRQGQNSAANCDDEKCISGENQKLTTVFRLISQKLESILVQTHNPQIYAALIGIAGRARQLEAVQYFWRTLIDEARLPRAEYGKERPHLLNSLTLGSYLSALINCKRYNDAVVAFLEYAFYKKTDHSHKAHMRSISSSLKLQSINRDVYETSLKAFALANQHKMCPVVINRMIDSGIQPSVLSLRHSLLSPDWRNSPSAEQPGFTHAWTLSLAIAREIWSLVLPTRQHIWARKELHGNLGASREMLEGELPVITNDVSSQLIRIAARARDIQFGEQVFAAFDSEINCFGTRYRKDATEGANNNKSGEGAGEQSLDNRNRFPSHMQCDPNVHTYTSMITLYASNADMYGVGKMWNLMLRDGVEPNLHTYTSLVVALHKYALRKRWRHSREHESSKGTDHIAGSAGRNDSDTQPWASTKHDKMIDSIEEWFVNKHDPETTQKPPYQSTADEASGNDDTSSLVNWFKEMASLDLDIPLSTLLLRYHAVRIREAMGRLSFNDYISKSAYSKDSVIKQIQRAMELCQKVESAGLQPDFKFHTALADLFDACGDKPGAELVRRRIEETYKKQQ
ncbi:hypothetical protein IW138_006289 [Coemansia sp. RSA 986]|nr:hypothetical protein IW138_006289 [Coemansia sp. RSA 986]